MRQNRKRGTSRRKFIAQTTSGVAAAVAAPSLNVAAGDGFHVGSNERLRIGLVGCGGRGTQAVLNAFAADPDSELVAMADAFPDRIELYHKELLDNEASASRTRVDPERMFAGFDCCERLVESGVDVVILATPPFFRPAQLRTVVEAGKHVFCEKPVAVDPPGVRSVLETCELAATKGLSVVSGLCYRYDIGVNAVMKQILEEQAIGEIRAIQENYLTGTLWHRGSNPNWSPMEYQMRNWLYFNWLSGDHIVEQHIHSLDKAMWLMNDEPPETAYGTGGRLVRTDERWGNIYDHFSTVFEWKNGVKMFSHCRQMAECMNDTEDYVIGTKGSAKILRKTIFDDANNPTWKFREKTDSMYDVEHQHLFRSIREGKPINDGKFMSYSTLLAIMGREACYTGKRIKWSELMRSGDRLGPSELKFGDYKPADVPLPGDRGW